MIKDYLLQLSFPDWLFAITVILLAGLATAYYYRTLPPLSPVRRIAATVLRGLSLSIVVFLLLTPTLRLMYQIREQPVIGVLLDNSASMKIPEFGGIRGDSLNTVRRFLSQIPGTDSLNLQPFSFDLQTRRLGQEPLSFDMDGSDITQALRAIRDSLSGVNLQALVLISDGVFNQGANPLFPARGLGVPVFTVLLGDSTEPRDIALTRLQTNQITYVNKTLPVEVTFRQNGFDGQPALLTIMEGRQRLAQRAITLGRSGFEQKVQLEITTDRPGDLNLTAGIQPLNGEITDHNNRRTTRIQVLKSKLRILCLSGAPNFDRESLSFAGRQLPDYRFDFLTEAASGRYYEGSLETVPMDSVDLLIFHGFPTSATSNAHLTTLMQQVRSRRVPILWLPNENANFQRLINFQNLIPFETAGRLTTSENQLIRLSAGRLHPAFRLDENESSNVLLWQELPPVSVFTQLKFVDGAQTLLETGNGERLPASVAYRQNEVKQLVLNFANFSNWHYQLQRDPARDRFFVQLVERVIRWLVNRDDIQQIQIQPQQSIYNVGEAVRFSGQVYDEFYQPVNDAEVRISVSNDTLQYADEMIAEGNGYYRQLFTGLPEGEFTYRIEARRNDSQIGVRSGRITVKPFFQEYQQIAANHSLLRQIARNTQGKAYTPGQFINHFVSESFQSRVQLNFSEYFLWHYWHWLAALVLLLGLEWFLRKRWGML